LGSLLYRAEVGPKPREEGLDVPEVVALPVGLAAARTEKELVVTPPDYGGDQKLHLFARGRAEAAAAVGAAAEGRETGRELEAARDLEKLLIGLGRED